LSDEAKWPLPNQGKSQLLLSRSLSLSSLNLIRPPLEHTDLTGNNAISKEKHKIQDFFSPIQRRP
jgi:hypothetical protein